MREGAHRLRRRPLANRSTGGGTQFRSAESPERSVQLRAACQSPASFFLDFARFHYRDNPSCVWSDGADLKRLAGRGERPDRDRARSTRDRSCSAVPRRPQSNSVVKIVQATACGGDTARRLTDWMMELHALRRARTEGEAERHDVSSDGRSNRHPSESRRVLVPSSASAQSARRATGKNYAFSSGVQVKSHVHVDVEGA